jgi:S-adenosylmethionine synthetase
MTRMMEMPLAARKTNMAMRKARSMACEFVTNGHPDKVCDQIADAILDAAMAGDATSRVAMEVTGGHGAVAVIGEITTRARFDIGQIVRETYAAIGHDHPIGVFVNVVMQSPHIAVGVDRGGAGDQGIMVGYAVNDGPNYMPRSWTTARGLCVGMREARMKKILPYLRPDGKSQVTMVSDRITQVTLAAHHGEAVDLDRVRADLLSHVIRPVAPDIRQDDVVVNGTGIFVQGGFDADADTTGRKLMVDNYGPNIEVGGGCYSGKDPSKVDRSAAYFCRMVAKSIVANGLANEAIVKVAFSIGRETPTLISIETDLQEDQALRLEHKVRESFDFRPKAMIERLGLLSPKGWCYRDTAAAGHYGDERFPWEQITKI